MPIQLYINFNYALTLSTNTSTHYIDKIMCTTNDRLCTMMKPHFIGKWLLQISCTLLLKSHTQSMFLGIPHMKVHPSYIIIKIQLIVLE